MPSGYVLDRGIWRAQNASLDHFDPEFLLRAQAFWADPRIGGKYYVESGSRSTEKQEALYKGFKAGKKGFSPANPPGTSLHEWLKTRLAMAIDAHPIPGMGGTYAELHAVAAEYGFTFPFAARKTPPPEPWHAQMDPKRKALPTPQEEADELPLSKYILIPCSTGGYWTLKRDDGGVGAYDGAPFFGSMPGAKAKVVGNLVGLTPCVVDGAVVGYWIVGDQGHVWAFPKTTPHFAGYAEHADWQSKNRKIIGLAQTAGFKSPETIRYDLVGEELGDPDYVVDAYDLGPEYNL